MYSVQSDVLSYMLIYKSKEILLVKPNKNLGILLVIYYIALWWVPRCRWYVLFELILMCINQAMPFVWLFGGKRDCMHLLA